VTLLQFIGFPTSRARNPGLKEWQGKVFAAAKLFATGDARLHTVAPIAMAAKPRVAVIRENFPYSFKGFT
jgi:hypothetical protein